LRKLRSSHEPPCCTPSIRPIGVIGRSRPRSMRGNSPPPGHSVPTASTCSRHEPRAPVLAGRQRARRQHERGSGGSRQRGRPRPPTWTIRSEDPHFRTKLLLESVRGLDRAVLRSSRGVALVTAPNISYLRFYRGALACRTMRAPCAAISNLGERSSHAKESPLRKPASCGFLRATVVLLQHSQDF
jgi:hypothetical protein